MGNVTLHIKGLSTSYYKNDVWNVVFPCDGVHHRVIFRYEKSDGSSGSPVSLENKNIRISTESDGIPPASPQDASFAQVLDLTSSNFHKEGLKYVANPPISKSFMTVKNALFSASEPRSRINFVLERRNPSSLRLLADKFASKITGKIELQTGGKVTMEVVGIPDFPKEFGAGDVLYFDNYCSDSSLMNDFQLYQDIFENSRDRYLKFDMLSFEFPPRLVGKPTVKKLLGGPPPAFCDGSRISETDDL